MVLFGTFYLTSSFIVLRCSSFKRLKEEAEKRKRPSWNEVKGSKTEGESDTKSNPTLARTTGTRGPPDPGMVNQAFDEGEDGIHVQFYLYCL